jgi:phage-related protein
MNITYNNKTPEDYDCWLATRPVITPSEGTRDRYQIPGRRGELLGKYETRSNAHINFVLHQKKTASTTHSLDECIAWLRQTGNLYMSDDDYNTYYEVLHTEVTAYDNKADDYKRVEVDMEVYPYKFLRTPTVLGVTINSGQSYTVNLPTDDCEPEYMATLVGTGTSSAYFTVNGGERFTVYAHSANIDTRRKTATRGASVSHDVSGDYDAIKLKHGQNTIQASVGMQLQVWSRDGYII